MPAQTRKVVLSRFFNNNVELVANMCSICYEECLDVRILSVNLDFLKQTVANVKNINFKNVHFLNVVDYPVIVQNVEEDTFGFSSEETNVSSSYAEKVNKILNSKKDIIDKLEENFVVLKTENNFFKGFSLEDIQRSCEDYKNVVENCEQIRYKIYKEISLKVAQNIYRNRTNTKYFRKPKTSKYFKTENQSDFSSNSVVSNKKNETNIKDIDCKMNNKCKLENCEHFKPDPDVCQTYLKTEINTIDYESEYFKLSPDCKKIETVDAFLPSKESFEDGISEKNFSIWIPPRSPHNLIEEVLYHDPWALLVATIFLNRTSCMCARPYVFWFLKENPDPVKVLEKYPEELEKYFVNLGLQKTRAIQVWRMSHDFLYKNWNNVKELYGIGEYGQNAFKMFCLGDFSVEPKDRFLKIYKAWYEKVEMKKPCEVADFAPS